MLKWILVVVIVVAFPVQVGHILADAVVMGKDALITMIAAYKSKGV